MSLLFDDKAESHACVWELKNDQKWLKHFVTKVMNVFLMVLLEQG